MISIIVPIYNTEQYLKKCIRSIQHQTMKEIEIILVDDGSKDSSGRICDEFAEKDDRIQVIHKSNEGLVKARKTGVRLARGSYIGFVDSDDWIEKEMFENMYHAARQEDADMVAEGYLEDMEGVCQSRKNVLKAGIYGTEEERAFFYRNMLNCDDYFCLGIQPFLWNKLIRRELAEKHIMAMDESIRVGEDAAVIYPSFLDAEKIVVLDDYHYHYCLRNASMSWKLESEEKEWKEVLALHIYLKNKFLEEPQKYGLKEQLRDYTVNNMLVRAFGYVAARKEGDVLFPFKGIFQGESVILYGAGALGRAIYEYIEKTGVVRIHGWVDQGASLYKKMGLAVEMPDTIRGNRTDKILIAVQKKQAVKEIEKKLVDMGIEGNRIVKGAFAEIWEYMEGI